MSKFHLPGFFPVWPPEAAPSRRGAAEDTHLRAPQGTDMKEPTTRGFLRGVLLLSLSAGRVGCFIVCGAGRPRSTAHQLRPPSSSCCVDRPLQTHQPQSREAGDTTMVLGGERRLVERARSGRTNCLRQVRCLLTCLLPCGLQFWSYCYMTTTAVSMCSSWHSPRHGIPAQKHEGSTWRGNFS